VLTLEKMRKTLFDLAGLNFKRDGVGGYQFRFHSIPPLEFAITVDEIRRNPKSGAIMDPGEIIMETFMERGYEFYPPEYHLAGQFFIRDSEYSLECVSSLLTDYKKLERTKKGSERYKPENLFHCLSLLRRAKQSDIRRFNFNTVGASMVPRIDNMSGIIYRMIEFPIHYGQIFHLEGDIQRAILEEEYENVSTINRMIDIATKIDPEKRVGSDDELLF